MTWIREQFESAAPNHGLMKVNVLVGAIHGLAENINGEGYVTVDPRQSQRDMLDTAIHEGLHIAFPTLSEEEVEKATKIIAQVPWALGYRVKKKDSKLLASTKEVAAQTSQ